MIGDGVGISGAVIYARKGITIGDDTCIGGNVKILDNDFHPIDAEARIRLLRDGHGVCALLEGILQVFPLDTYEQPVYIMERVQGDTVPVPIWDDFRRMLAPHTEANLCKVERFAFYERAKHAYAVVQTGESAQYANVILKKGVVR